MVRPDFLRSDVDGQISDEGEPLVSSMAHRMRDPGAAAMREPSTQWDAVDEALDASFPASDPPSFTPKIA